MAIKLKGRFWVASIVLWAIFLVNLCGLYGDGFIKKYYTMPEIEHLIAAFFLAMWLSSFSRSTWFVLSGLVVFIIF